MHVDQKIIYSGSRPLWPAILVLVSITAFGILLGTYHRGLSLQFRPPAEVSKPAELGVGRDLKVDMVDIDEGSLRRTVGELSSYDSRMTGCPGSDSAAVWLEREFSNLGLSVAKMRFQTPVPLDRGFSLKISPDGPSFELFGLWPNLVRTPTLPQGGLTGILLYGGKGELGSFNGQDIKGNIILMDFDSGMDWVNAFELGASAVIFLGSDGMDRFEAEQKFLSVPADLPRFWVSGDIGNVLRAQVGSEITLTGRMDWEEVWGVNIIGILEGKDPSLKDHAIILDAYYDGISVVPGRAPSAESSSGVAVLLEAARYLSEHRPSRTVIFLASGGHFEALSGIRNLVALLDKGVKTLEEERSNLEGHLLFLGRYSSFLGSDVFRDINDEGLSARILEELRADAVSLVSVLEDRLGHKFDYSERARIEGILKVLKPLRWVKDISSVSVLFDYPDILSSIRDLKEEESLQSVQKLAVLDEHLDFLRKLTSYRLDIFSGLDLSTGSDKIGIFGIGGFYTNGPGSGVNRQFHGDSPFRDLIITAGRKVELELTSEGSLEPPLFLDAISSDRKRRVLGGLSENIAFNSGALNAWGFLGITLATLNDIRPRVDTPLDVVDRMDFSNLARQAEFALPLLYLIADDPNIAILEKEKNSFGYLSGRVVRFDPKVSFVPDTPVPDSIVRLRLSRKTIVGVRSEPMVMTDREGAFSIPGVLHSVLYLRPNKVEAYHLNAEDGSVDLVHDLGVNGAMRYPVEIQMDRDKKQISIVLFRGRGMTIFEPLDHRYLDVLDNLSVLEEGRETEPIEFSYILPHMGSLDDHHRWMGPTDEFLTDPCVVVFAPPGLRIKIAMTMGKYGMGQRFLLLNSSRKDPVGLGFMPSKYDRFVHIPYQVARDIYYLNNMRIRNLQDHGIRNERLYQIHQQVKHYLEAAEESLEDRKYDRFAEMSRLAWSYDNRAYRDIHSTTKDVVQGVLFYMALLIPFAYFGERLLLAGPTIKKQVMGLVSIFLLAFLMLRWVHPAFSLTLNSSVILLGFIVFGLSVLVIKIGFSRLQQQIKRAVRRVVGMHRADVNRASAVWSAFDLGINNMRRRKVRTVLTLLTIVLVTFSVLSFTSVSTFLRFNRVSTQGKASYNGLLVRKMGWKALNNQVYESIKNLYRDQIVAPRVWLQSKISWVLGGEKTIRIERSSGPEKSTTVSSLLGLTPQEIELIDPRRALYAGRWFEPGEEDVCILPDNVARLLHIGLSDLGKVQIKLEGRLLNVIGLINGSFFDSLLDLNNEPITPLDPVAIQPVEKDDTSIGKEMIKESKSLFIHLPSERLIIVPYTVAIRLGGVIESVGIGFEDGRSVEEAIERWMPGLAVNLFAGIDGRKYLLNAVGMQSVGGLGSLVIPILIGALIVLNTMLGSVYEREGEINTCTAVGLSPTHIAGLFLAEATVYATFGAVLGYLLGQILSKVLTSFSLLPGLTLNYSSISVVYTVVIVMVVVVLSSVYPASLAFSVAASAVQRRWNLPDAVGDELSTTIPVTVHKVDVAGLMAFLTEYFLFHEEQTVAATFYTRNVEYSRFETSDGTGYRVRVKVWLTPFDLNISQQLTLESVPSGDRDIYLVKAYAVRTSGERSGWQHKNYTFFNDIRKQFLIWRTVGKESRELYESRALEMEAKGSRAPVGI